MALTERDIATLASQDFILSNATADEQYEFISDQIANPFDSGNTNFFKQLKKLVTADRLDEYCIKLFGNIEDRYPGIEFDFSEYDQHLDQVFDAVYKFFIKNIQRNMYVFLKEYISSAKNRKLLIADYLNAKLPNYPKEQYGKKEFYILITKLPAIVKDIGKDDIKLTKFINYIERAGSDSSYVRDLKEFIEAGIVCDHGVIRDIFDVFIKSEEYNSVMCKLQMFITQDIILPYLEANNLIELRTPPSDPIEDEIDDDDDSDD